jgi:anti-sigma regulatory factor (Ser/Thr protein kinase)
MATRSPRAKALEIRDFVLDRVAEGADNVSTLASKKFGISRQAAHRYLHQFVDEGILEATGETRNRKYSLKPLEEKTFKGEISPDLKEDVVWREEFLPMMRTVPRNVLRICEYGFTEMLNNAIDHSSGSTVSVTVIMTKRSLEIRILDNGIGIFQKIQNELKLAHPREAILELSKGKLTTDPAHHTGEGVFFTMRAFDKFAILSGPLYFSHTEPHDDWLIEDKEELKGTYVLLTMALSSKRNLEETFNRFASVKDDYSFTKTNVPVALARIGQENLISRSQAKRLLSRFERFRKVWLDFQGVDVIGQAFADEIFRVYAKEHPDVHLTWIHASAQVKKMIERALKAV